MGEEGVGNMMMIGRLRMEDGNWEGKITLNPKDRVCDLTKVTLGESPVKICERTVGGH